MHKNKPDNKVVNLLEIINHKKRALEGSEKNDLQHLLKEAHKLSQNVSTLHKDITPVTQEEAVAIIRISLVAELKKSGGLNSASFLCATYAANLLTELFYKTPKYWTAFDFLEESTRKRNPYIMQKGADMCFLISSFFTGRGDWRTMKLSYYRSMGIGLYFSFYSQTKREIGLHMSENFLFISDIANKGLETIKHT